MNDILEELKSIEGDAIRRAEKEIVDLRANVEACVVNSQKIVQKLSGEINALRKKDDTDPIFEGAEINGKRFPFIPVSINSVITVAKKFHPYWFEVIYNFAKQKKRIAYLKANPDAKYSDLVRLGLVYFSVKAGRREWKNFRNVAFVKTGLWKRFGIVPKELRCNRMNARYAEEVKKNFGIYFSAKEKESNVLSDLPKDSEIKNAQKK